MKKWILFLLLIGLVITGYKYADSRHEVKDLQSSIDAKFRYELSEVLGSLNKEMDDYTYRSFLSNMSDAAALSDLTSYEEQNDELDVSLYSLFVALREEKSKDKVLARADELREVFKVLVMEPANKEATDQINQITKETFFTE